MIISPTAWWWSLRRALLTTAVALVGLAASCRSPDSAPITTPEAAIAVAKSGWVGTYDKTHYELYSKKETARFEPYTATLNDGIWTVKGTIPPGYHGYTLVTSVRAADGSASSTSLEFK